MGKRLAVAFLLITLCGSARAQTVQIGVLGIFHPHQLTITVPAGETMVLSASGKTIFLEPKLHSSIAQIRASPKGLLLEAAKESIRAEEIHAANRDTGAANIVLSVPGKIKRKYRGVLDIKWIDGAIVPVVTMELETAVASVVAAESAPDTPLEALKAQAIVSRSYLIAGGGRHANFDFCDLTHCQFLREPPGEDSAAFTATMATRGLILEFEEKPFAAMFTRSCGGHTLTPAEIGMQGGAYPYFSVECEFCYRNPVRWVRRVSPQDAALLLAQGEAGRLAVDRRLGWDMVPSNSFTTRRDGAEIVLDGTGQGHGVGFCQRGARAMAAAGAEFHSILAHYFPNTTVGTVGKPAPVQNP